MAPVSLAGSAPLCPPTMQQQPLPAAWAPPQAPPAGLLRAPCGCYFDPRVFRVQWMVPYNHQGTAVAAATPVLPPHVYQQLVRQFARLTISSKATAAGTTPADHARPSCSAAPKNKATGDPRSHVAIPKKTIVQDARRKKELSSIPKPDETGCKRRHEQGHSPEPPSKRSTGTELPQSQAAPAEQRGRKRGHEWGHSPESESPSKRSADVELLWSQAATAEQRGRKRGHERGHSPESEPPSKRRMGVAGGVRPRAGDGIPGGVGVGGVWEDAMLH
ncbi:uncharacterized protein LOC135576454 [Columba livia]|uniref:uncharacterized protein LOC135576454 n=1 Tax=Columba livia TaxID=8932 RepID=UPI0031BB3F03